MIFIMFYLPMVTEVITRQVRAGGHGLKDIYTVYPGYVGKKPSIYLIKGKITEKGTPIASTILVEILDQNNKKFGEFVSNSINW
jgi:hypothetical protein